MKRFTTNLTELLGIDHPVVQEGMGPFRTVALAIAVSEAGGLGTVSMPGLTRSPRDGARTMREHIDLVAAGTTGTFTVNVPVGRQKNGEMLPPSRAYVEAVLAAREADSAVHEQLRVITTSGGFPGEFRGKIRDAGLLHMHKIGSTRQAVKAVEAGADILIAAGAEMGGHTHARPVHTFVLVPSVISAVDVPVVLAGGARDASSLASALAMGACGIAMGTRFIVTSDNVEWHQNYKQRLIDAREGEDTTFPAVFGPARGLRSPAQEQIERLTAEGRLSDEELTRWKDDALIRAQRDGDLATGLIASGQVASAITSLATVRTLLQEIVDGAADRLARITRSIVEPCVSPTG